MNLFFRRALYIVALEPVDDDAATLGDVADDFVPVDRIAAASKPDLGSLPKPSTETAYSLKCASSACSSSGL